jgi:hypothetical protein
MDDQLVISVIGNSERPFSRPEKRDFREYFMNSKNQGLAKGYMNKVLYINLSAASYHTEPMDPKIVELFFGGRG